MSTPTPPTPPLLDLFLPLDFQLPKIVCKVFFCNDNLDEPSRRRRHPSHITDY